MEVNELKTMFYHPILAEAPKEVKAEIEKNSFGYGIKYVGYLMDEYDGDVILRVWAHKTTKKYGTEVREVIRTVLGKDGVIYRDMYFGCNSGWKVAFRPGHCSCSNWYGYSYYAYNESDFGKWHEDNDIGVVINIVNMDMLKDTKFKYSGFNGKSTLIKWMRVYEKYPQVELLGKLGYEPSVKLLKKCQKDKGFARFLAKNELKDTNLNAICYAYDHHIGVKEAGELLWEKNHATQFFRGCTDVRASGIDLVKAYKYCNEKRTGAYSYNDYITACRGLGLDLTDTKNAFPKEFRRMHDLRTNSYKAQIDKQIVKDFKKATEQYVKFETEDKIYTVLIPRSKKDLIHEGAVLHHCVGKMGYDRKMVAGTSFIGFVRKTEEKNKPYVTVEFDMKDKRVVQAYGDHDSKPDKEVLDFIDKWSKGVKKAL